MSEPNSLINNRVCKRCGKAYYNRKKPKSGQKTYCSFACYRPKKFAQCEWCDGKFRFKQGDRTRFCSRKCYDANRQAEMTFQCETCDKSFQRRGARKDTTRFCSRRCSTQAQKRTVHLKCGTCQIPIERQPAFAKSKTQYCSRECFGQSKIDRIDIPCKHCGKAFSVTPYFAKTKRVKFCSKRCRVRFKGETNIERIMRLALNKIGIKYRQEYHLPKEARKPGTGYVADFYLPEVRIDIEVDGMHWHGKKKGHDQKRDRFLRRIGIQVIRFKDSELLSNSNVTDLVFQRLLPEYLLRCGRR